MTPPARLTRRILAAGAVIVTVILAAVTPPAAAESVPGSAGTDTSLAATESQVVASGRGPFADLRITVNQTRNLVNQAVSITWKGATPTRVRPIRFGGHYLQIMQCWGDDDGSVPGNPGPPPEQCVQGATDAVYGGRNSGVFPAGGNALERIISRRGWPNFNTADGHHDERTGYLWKPFRAVDGAVTDVHYDPDFNPSIVGGNYWLNPEFNAITTNEIAGGRTGPNGEGAELFEVSTGVESSGLGCGQIVQPVAGGSPIVPKCWIVVVPRGGPVEENAGTPFEDRADQTGVYTSPLAPQPWQNRIAIPLEFNPVDSPCSLADDQRRLVGTELAIGAVSSWQPKLCASPGLPPYAYGIISDAGARQQLLRRAAGAPGMVVVSRPFEQSRLEADNPVTYAPLSLSALVIGFNIERNPNPNRGGPGAEAFRGVRVAQLNLTPRLVAKLLSQSYRSQVAIKEVFPPTHEWARDNPKHLGLDPDFLQFNPEFAAFDNGGRNLGGLVMSSLNSDAARQVWEWVLSDPEAKAWLDGAPDPFGMDVNPVYATSAAANSLGAAFGDPPPDSFPKADPYCFQAPAQGPGGAVVPPLLCGTDWMPYTQSMREAARRTRVADDGAKTNEDPFAVSPDKVYRPNGPQSLGSKTILSLTDSPSAAQYGLQTARLSRSGDNGPGRTFIAPDSAGLTAGVDAMTAKDEPAVLEPAPTAAAPSAYPLTALTYAAVTPLVLDEQARKDYAAFVDYAAGPGQIPGLELGQLPPGFAPLSESLRAQATASAKTIRELTPAGSAAAGTQPVPAPTSTAPATPGAAAIGSGSSTSRSSTAGGGGSGQSSTTPAASSQSGAAETAAAPTAIERTQQVAARALTPVVALAQSRFAMPALLGIALLSALGALEITKRPRYVPGARPSPGGRAPGDGPAGVSRLRRVTSRWTVKR